MTHSRFSTGTLLHAGGAFAGGTFLFGLHFGMIGAVLGGFAAFGLVLLSGGTGRPTDRPATRRHIKQPAR